MRRAQATQVPVRKRTPRATNNARHKTTEAADARMKEAVALSASDADLAGLPLPNEVWS